jgi:diguanylate cyclase
MTDDAQRWKEKYLKSIEQQDKLERRWSARLDLLRRGLVRSTLAAEGTDKAVDQCMKEMREIIRTDDMDAGLARLIPRLEKTVLDSEQRRATRVVQISTALSALVAQLQTLPLSREVSKPLKRFAKQVDDRAAQSREIPLLLSELSDLQGQALAQLDTVEEAERSGLFQRLFGSRELAEPQVLLVAEAAVPALAQPAAPAAQAETVRVPEPIMAFAQAGEPVVTEPELEVLVEPATLPVFIDSLPLPAVMAEAIAAMEPQASGEEVLYALPDSPEPSYSSVAVHIEETLLGLLADLTLPERHRPQAEAMQNRLRHGLNWYELLPILDDLATLMLAINNNSQHDFELYLKQLNERLDSFQSHLQAASTGHADSRSASRDMDSELREHVDDLQSSVQHATDIDSLKQVLDNRLEGLLGTMDAHQQQRDAREQAIATRLQGLAERVASMELEAQGYREHLEEQRQKALVDPLTGLPNRAAWTERLEQQVATWQQSGGDLLLAMLDLDHFKLINDSYGHLAGDKVLKIIAGELRKRLRPDDFIARFGGEEFVLMIPATRLPDGMRLVELMRAAIEACPFHFKGQRVTITVSIGISAFKPGERSDLVLKRADEALYRAKNAGRNRIEAG